MRRNGQPQSCEPCRKWKTRCNHARPVCQRCVDRRIADQCFYHPAPMSGRARGSRTAHSDSRRPVAPDLNAEYPDPESRNATETTPTPTSATAEQPSAEVSSGLQVLRFLKSHRQCDSLVRSSYLKSRAPILPYYIVDAFLQSTRDMLDQNRDGLQQAAANICDNSHFALEGGLATTADEYISLMTGKNLRWEAIGNVLAIAGQALVATPDNDSLFAGGRQPSHATLLSRISEACDLCISLCAHSSSSNEMLVAFQVNDMMLKTQQHGDSSYAAWRRLGNVSATIYFSGLHKQDADSKTIPPFLTELRRGCFATAFYVDKCLATFLGRPPLLNYRHCQLVPPLDLADDVLVGDATYLANAIETQVGPDGWGRQGLIYRTSLTRLRLQLALSRGKVLECTAREHGPDTLSEVNALLDEAQSEWERVPDHLRHDRYLPNGHLHYRDTLTILLLYLDYLHNRFLLLEYVSKSTDASRAAFMDTSRQMLAATIEATKCRTSHMDLSRDYSWIALYYGIPCATLLAQDLRRSRSQGSREPSASQVIRDLCVFVSVLSWVVSPDHGDYRICKDAERRLSRMVDDLLDPLPTNTDIFPDPMVEWIDYDSLELGSILFS